MVKNSVKSIQKSTKTVCGGKTAKNGHRVGRRPNILHPGIISDLILTRCQRYICNSSSFQVTYFEVRWFC